MDVLMPKKAGRGKTPSDERRAVNPAVSWIAIVIGVFLVAVGILLLLWGMSWQGASEDEDPLAPDDGVGGPILLPLGVFVIVVGMVWILNGYRVFGRKGAEKRTCPGCGRSVEADLSVCYHCGEEIPDEGRPPRRGPSRR